MKWFESLSIERQSPALCTCGCFCTKMTRLAQAPGCWCDDAITLDQAGRARRRFEAAYKLCEVASLSNLKTRLSPGSHCTTVFCAAYFKRGSVKFSVHSLHNPGIACIGKLFEISYSIFKNLDSASPTR